MGFPIKDLKGFTCTLSQPWRLTKKRTFQWPAAAGYARFQLLSKEYGNVKQMAAAIVVCSTAPGSSLNCCRISLCADPKFTLQRLARRPDPEERQGIGPQRNAPKARHAAEGDLIRKPGEHFVSGTCPRTFP